MQTLPKRLRLGLIGKDVSKSTSERIHTFILNAFGIACDYTRFSVDSANLDTAMRTLLGDFDGFNVTIPYKKDVFEYLYDIDGEASACGAVNTVVTRTKTGYNTDGAGFLLMLQTHGIDVAGKKVLVLGAGGSGRSSAVSLKNAGADVYLYRRNRVELLETCARLGVQPAEDIEAGGYDILINCTGVGMHDTEGKSPVNGSVFVGGTWAVDLIYAPKQSAFLSQAKARGLSVLNGESMLFYQAYFADCIYLGISPSVEQAKVLYAKYVQS